MRIPAGDDLKKAPKAKNNISIVANHNRKSGWRLPEINFHQKANNKRNAFFI